MLVTEDGKRRTIPAKRALLLAALADALRSGDVLAVTRIFALFERLAPGLLQPEKQPILIRSIPGDFDL